MKTCRRCLFTDKIPGIKFNKNGTCNYCDIHDQLEEQYPTNINKLNEIAQTIKRKRRRVYDVIVGVSGGCDSSYMLRLAKQLGLNPLAVHFDNGFDSEISQKNMSRICTHLKVDYETRTVDQAEYNDIYHSFFKAGLPDIEAVTDIALMATLYESAWKHKVKYIFVGHSFRTEGIAPLGYTYMDSGYVRSVQKRFGTLKIKTLPELRFFTFLKYMFAGIKRIRPLYYINYNKDRARKVLTSKYGWEWYGGLHKESIITDYVKNFWAWTRYGIDKRVTEFSGLIRSNLMSRQEAFYIMKNPPEISNEVFLQTIKLLGFNPAKYIAEPRRTYKDFGNYKIWFKIFKPLFWVFLKLDRIPLSFYTKYCK